MSQNKVLRELLENALEEMQDYGIGPKNSTVQAITEALAAPPDEEALAEVSWVKASNAAAYRRGAEAMREAAASCVGSDTALLQTYRSVLEGRIRDLPVLEDK